MSETVAMHDEHDSEWSSTVRPPSGPGLKERAIRLLAQREHARAELVRKLASHARDPHELDSVLDQLHELGLQSDARFAASYIRAHATRFGLSRLRFELRQRGVPDAIAQEALAQELDSELGEFGDELSRARQVWEKKFGNPPEDAKEWARQARFLQSRGFSGDTLKKLLKDAS